MLNRSATHANGIVVFDRNSQANSTIRGSPLRRLKVCLAPPHPSQTLHHQPLRLRGLRLLHRPNQGLL